jgi:predicted HicB family RNase H-like nuclease
LDVFLRMCEEDCVSPKRPQGKFALRLDPETYYAASVAAVADGISLNQWIARTVREAVRG